MIGVSIIIPIKENDVELIKNKLNSFSNQDEVNVLFIDAGSSDEVISLIKNQSNKNIAVSSIQDNDKKIDYNYPIAANYGASISISEYLLISDVDIFFSVDEVKKLYFSAKKDDLDFITGKVNIKKDGRVFEHPSWKDSSTWFSLIKKSFFEKIGGFNEDYAGYYGHNDGDYKGRINKYKAKVGIESEAVSTMVRPDKGSYTNIDHSRNLKLTQELHSGIGYVIVPKKYIEYPGFLTYKDMQAIIHYSINAKNGVVEIGSLFGKATNLFLNYSSVPVVSVDNYSFDTVYSKMKDDGGVDLTSQKYSKKEVQAIYSKLLSEYNAKLSLVVLDSDKAFLNIKNESYDLLFIDGDHELSQVQKDFNNYYSKLSPGGVILFHDYPNEYGVKVFIDGLINKNIQVEKYGFCAIIKKSK